MAGFGKACPLVGQTFQQQLSPSSSHLNLAVETKQVRDSWPNLFCLHPSNVSSCSIVWNWPGVLAAGSNVPIELFLMATVFMKLISFPSTPCVADKMPLCFSSCRRIENPFRCFTLPFPFFRQRCWLHSTDQLKDKLLLLCEWLNGRALVLPTKCVHTVVHVWLNYRCLLSEGPIFSHKFWVIPANGAFQQESCARGRDGWVWTGSSGFQAAVKILGNTAGCCLWKKRKI